MSDPPAPAPKGATITDVQTSGSSSEQEKKVLSELLELNKDLSLQIKELEKEREDYQQTRKKDLLEQFDKKTQEKYKDKSVQDLELLLEYVRDNPPKRSKGITRGSDSDKDKDKDFASQLASGEVGSYDFKTGKWKK